MPILFDHFFVYLFLLEWRSYRQLSKANRLCVSAVLLSNSFSSFAILISHGLQFHMNLVQSVVMLTSY